MSNDSYYIHLQNPEKDVESEPWKALDEVVRKWVTLSGHEKDLSDYQKRKELYE
jgi:hypothetical protein